MQSSGIRVFVQPGSAVDVVDVEDVVVVASSASCRAKIAPWLDP